MSGRSTCQAIQAIRTQGQTDRAAMDVFNNINPLTKFGANNEATNTITNFLRNSITNTTRLNIEEKCNNSTKINQTNVYNGSDKCMIALYQTCKNPLTGVTDLACLDKITKILEDLRKSNVKAEQTNINTTRTICEINSYIQALSNQETSLSNIAKLLSMQEAKTLLSSNKADNLNCNDVDINVTNEQFISSVLGCLNETSINQNNIINDDSCGARMSNQLNSNSIFNNCLIDNGILVSNTQKASITNDSSLENKQTASAFDLGSSMMIIIMIGVVFVAILVLPNLVGGGKNKNNND
jgi:hypothetical protein